MLVSYLSTNNINAASAKVYHQVIWGYQLIFIELEQIRLKREYVVVN